MIDLQRLVDIIANRSSNRHHSDDYVRALSYHSDDNYHILIGDVRFDFYFFQYELTTITFHITETHVGTLSISNHAGSIKWIIWSYKLEQHIADAVEQLVARIDAEKAKQAADQAIRDAEALRISQESIQRVADRFGATVPISTILDTDGSSSPYVHPILIPTDELPNRVRQLEQTLQTFDQRHLDSSKVWWKIMFGKTLY